MTYIKCRRCKFRCTCCKSREDKVACSGCENSYDEFQPAMNIFYCPLNGKPVQQYESCKVSTDD